MNLSTNLGGGCHSSRGRGKIWICNPCTYLLFASVYLGFAFADVSIQNTDYGCEDPEDVGELKLPLSGMKCVDSSYDSGSKTYILLRDCYGYDDQKFKFCENGTIRSVKNNYCIDREGSTGLALKPCSLNNDMSQKWTKIYRQNFGIDGINHDLYSLQNVESGDCLYFGYESNVAYLKYCDNGDRNNYVTFHNRGKVLGHGSLRNKETGEWLTQGLGRELVYLTSNRPSYSFIYYRNGDLMNLKTGLCVLRKVDSFELETRPCNDDRKRFNYKDYGDNIFGFWYYSNGGMCLTGGEVGHSDKSFGTVSLKSQCTIVENQMWEWVEGNWHVPIGEWRKVGCYVNNLVTTRTVSNLESYGVEAGVEISNELSVGFEVKGIGASSTLSSTVYASMSASWEREVSDSISITQTCPGSKSCLWQWDMTMEHVGKPDLPAVKWESGSYYCSDDTWSPVCPAHSKCADAECRYCEAGLEEPGRNFKDIHEKLKRSSDEL